MKKQMIIPMLLLFISAAANAQVTWQEINGLKWSQILKGRYDNLEQDRQPVRSPVVRKSQATEACKAIGGELPTIDDFKSLQINDGFKKISGISSKWFWSSSTNYGYYDEGAYVFSGSGNTAYYRKNADQSSIVCVQRI